VLRRLWGLGGAWKSAQGEAGKEGATAKVEMFPWGNRRGENIKMRGSLVDKGKHDRRWGTPKN